MTFNKPPDSKETSPNASQAAQPKTAEELAALDKKYLVDPPEEIIIDMTPPDEIKVDITPPEAFVENGVIYGGPDHLPKPPEEIDLDFPAAPPEINHVL